jgi:hypothetical protein
MKSFKKNFKKFKKGNLYKNRWGEVYRAERCSTERTCPLYKMTSCAGIVLAQVNSSYKYGHEMLCSSMSGAQMLTTKLSKIEAMLYAL